MDEDAKAVLAEAEKTKAGYEAQLKSADEEIARRQREANEALQHAVDERRAPGRAAGGRDRAQGAGRCPRASMSA